MKISFSWLLVGLFFQTASIPSFGQVTDLEIVLYEQTSRMGALGNFFSGMISKDRSGQTVIAPFGLSKGKNKKLQVCYVLKTGTPNSDDEFIVNNLKRSLGKDKTFFAAVGSEDIQLNVYPDFRLLGQGMIKNQCEYIAVADNEIPKIDETIKLTDDKTEKTFKKVDGFKVSSTKLWTNPAPGEPLSRQEYLTSKRCILGDGKSCKKDSSELILEHLKAERNVVEASEPTKCIFDVRIWFKNQSDGQDWVSFNNQRRYIFNNVIEVRIEQTINTEGGSADARVRVIAKEFPYSLIFRSRNDNSIVYVDTFWAEAISPRAVQFVRASKMDIPTTVEKTYGQFFFTTLDDAQRYKNIVIDLAKECSASR